MPGVRVANDPPTSVCTSVRKLPNASPYAQGSVASLKEQDSSFSISSWDRLAYHLENSIAADPYSRFTMLLILSGASILVLGFCWYQANYDTSEASLKDSLWIATQVLISAGFEDSFESNGQILVFFLMLMFGVTLVALLIGLITDSVDNYMNSLSDGRTKVTVKGHTLLLGWNESSARVVTQIAFLRSVYQMNNFSWKKRIFPWLRSRPSTPVAGAPIIIMCQEDKGDVEKIIDHTFSERGVSSKHTMLGRDVVFRRGNPCDAHDLVRAGAHNATSILVMMTKADTEEEHISDATVANSATIRCLLALRNVLADPADALPGETFSPHLSCVVCQLSQECEYIRATTFARRNGKPLLFARDLTSSKDTMIFNCAVSPGLSRVFMNLFNFEGVAIRSRHAGTLEAGPENAVGWMVDRKVQECVLGHHWGNGIVLGFAEANTSFFEESTQPNDRKFQDDYGLMGDPNRIVLASDAVVFISTSSSPSLIKGGAEKVKQFKLEATTFKEPTSQKATDSTSKKRNSVAAVLQQNASLGSDQSNTKRVLVLGWRDEWEKESLRVMHLLEAMGVVRVHVTFFNIKTTKSMNKFCKEIGFSVKNNDESDDGYWKSKAMPNVTIGHHEGVPIHYDAVGALFKKEKFDTAIVLGSVVGEDLPDSSRDARVLSILLILRELNAKNGNLMHIIAENQLDQTASLALAPARSENVEPDFINTQAIVARTLVMNLAYPEISKSIFELFGVRAPSQPEVEFLCTSLLGIEGGSMSFGAIVHLVNNLFVGRGIPLGYFDKNKLVLSPNPDEVTLWTKDHRIVAIVRNLDILPVVERGKNDADVVLEKKEEGEMILKGFSVNESFRDDLDDLFVSADSASSKTSMPTKAIKLSPLPPPESNNHQAGL